MYPRTHTASRAVFAGIGKNIFSFQDGCAGAPQLISFPRCRGLGPGIMERRLRRSASQFKMGQRGPERPVRRAADRDTRVHPVAAETQTATLSSPGNDHDASAGRALPDKPGEMHGGLPMRMNRAWDDDETAQPGLGLGPVIHPSLSASPNGKTNTHRAKTQNKDK
jgi:hypothetical protein